MATTIKLKNGSGAPTTGDLVQGEPAFDLTNKRLYTENSGGSVIEVGTNPTSLTTTTVSATGSVTGQKLVASEGLLELDDNGTHNGIINVPASLFINIDSDNTNTGEDFVIAKDRTSASGGTELFRVQEDGNVGIGTASPNAYANYTTLTLNGATSSALDFEGGGTLMAEVLATANDLILQTTNSDGQLIFKSAAGSEAMRISSAGDLSVGSVSNHAGARVVINDTPPTAFGSPMFQVGQETFTTSGIYSIGFGFTNGTYTEPPAEIAAVSTSASGGTTADIIFGTRNVTTNTAVTERMRIDSNGNVGIGTSSINASYRLNVEGAIIPILAKSSSTGTSSTYACVATARPLNVVGNGSGYGMNMNNSSGSMAEYGYIGGLIENNTASSHSGALIFAPTSSGTRTERMRISSAGNVGIGTTSPTHDLTVGSTGAADYVIALRGGVGGFLGWDDSANTTILQAPNTRSLSFQVNSDTFSAGTEAMRIDSSGNVLIGVTTSVGGGSEGIELRGDAGYYKTARYTAGSAGHWLLYNSNGNVGSVTTSNSSTQFNTSSDERLKENIVDAPAGNIDAIRVRSFDWKVDGLHQTYGMVAQELVDVAPEAVSQGETEEDMWGVDYSKLVPMMIKEIQDLKAEVAALKGE